MISQKKGLHFLFKGFTRVILATVTTSLSKTQLTMFDKLCLFFKNGDLSEMLCFDSQPPPAITSTQCLIAAVLLRLTTTLATTLWPIQGAVLLLYFPFDPSHFKNGLNAT